MVNHARTLLLNRAAAQLSGGWEQYTDPSFQPQPLPAALDATWKMLFGLDPDVETLHWRVHQYLRLLHGSEFGSYLYHLDPRVSYDPARRLADAEQLPVAIVMPGPDSASDGIRVSGKPVDDAVLGRMAHLMAVRSLGSGNYEVQDHRYGKVSNVSWTDGNPLAMGSSGMLWRPVDTTAGRSWLVQAVAAPQYSLASLPPRLKTLPAEHLSNILGTNSREPFASFRRLWTSDRGFTLRLTGFLLAWIYRAEMLRRA